jgi:pimeloyl-ACP methyl ester carboxylesterase
MKNNKPVFLFVHGAWHNSSSFQPVIDILAARGHDGFAIDLPGAGVNSTNPRCYVLPSSAAAFAAELSPSRTIEQSQRTIAVIDRVRQIKDLSQSPIILVGHSLGGVTATTVAESVPDEIHAVVYLAAFMVPPGLAVGWVHQHPAASSSLVRSLIVADPKSIGAQRINFRSADPDYRRRLKLAFLEDASEATFASHISDLHCDEPNSTILVPSPMTAARFGKVPRYYIRCLQDRALPIEAQSVMISEVDSALGSTTHVHDLQSGHLSFVSCPGALSDVLMEIARSEFRQQ